MDEAIQKIFYPKTICIVGASTKEKSIGYELLKSIKNYGYQGKLFPVDPKADSVLGCKCYHTISDIADVIDLAIVMVPKAFAEQTIDELLSKAVKSIILITAGFKEVGKEGEEMEKRILQKVTDAGARLVGPNCMGVICTFADVSLNATFVAEKPEIGATGFCSQSGAIAAAVLNSLRETNIRFGHMISVGNKADISENDILRFWNDDERIKTITFYLESFSDGEGFIKQFIHEKGINKPVIILKGGRTRAGIKAASSHTGAMAANDKVVEAILKQFGMIRVDNLSELFNTAKGFENFPALKGNRVVVITNAGGPAILAVDSLEKEGLVLSELSQETKNKLRGIVHPEGSVQNPIDLLPGGTAQQFKSVNNIVAQDENVDVIISIFVEPIMVPAFEVIEGINSLASDKPIFQVIMPLPESWEKYRKDSLTKKPLFRNPEDPAKIISNILFYSKRKDQRKYSASKIPKIDLSNSSGFIDQAKIEMLCSAYNIPLIKSLIVKKNMINKSELPNCPLVLKGLSKKVVHKSELNAVKLNLKNKEELLQAELEILNSFQENNIELEEFLIQPFISAKYEILIGGFRDNSFGPMIMFGSGGKYVEVFQDTCMKSAFLSEEDVDEMIDSTKIGKILKGARGEMSFDLNALKKIILSSAQMMLDHPNIVEFDFNPLVVSKDNSFHTVDVRIKTHSPNS
ncbi:MAG: acetyl-CoA synthetase [Ignavibacteria bacterium RIFOXYB2_FULL_35_12]|nr:MAG: acetyl-CoA synthetase [Ignavibacteria bacterium GWA2_36_19]OGU62525.1 MAG: acetyl-CoA synthetase [Ignavibacteria bacterium GWF2_35_20]OGU81756.1 MAG: acetyl-CoA synthetase [Ignavibacteria bacterium RIFOXYA2_FULL_35_9]OGU87583.1 MAG: acetyl-CoA synthetase [Ignavibacteria bacterium RIFOXYA12_FULL_35_25]OGU88014.1 MAG: acetyl-CoA synthetase [Ignavibacteria bacterium RIFOXYC12_FULL_35_11]OGU96154.1 MAG: acetyl-CoA synthetase [Ignavibacteria bacterium RIFOXYB12_FULL_35_14]OGU99840.1 MAG: a